MSIKGLKKIGESRPKPVPPPYNPPTHLYDEFEDISFDDEGDAGYPPNRMPGNNNGGYGTNDFNDSDIDLEDYGMTSSRPEEDDNHAHIFNESDDDEDDLYGGYKKQESGHAVNQAVVDDNEDDDLEDDSDLDNLNFDFQDQIKDAKKADENKKIEEQKSIERKNSEKNERKVTEDAQLTKAEMIKKKFDEERPPKPQNINNSKNRLESANTSKQKDGSRLNTDNSIGMNKNSEIERGKESSGGNSNDMYEILGNIGLEKKKSHDSGSFLKKDSYFNYENEVENKKEKEAINNINVEYSGIENKNKVDNKKSNSEIKGGNFNFDSESNAADFLKALSNKNSGSEAAWESNGLNNNINADEALDLDEFEDNIDDDDVEEVNNILNSKNEEKDNSILVGINQKNNFYPNDKQIASKKPPIYNKPQDQLLSANFLAEDKVNKNTYLAPNKNYNPPSEKHLEIIEDLKESLNHRDIEIVQLEKHLSIMTDKKNILENEFNIKKSKLEEVLIEKDDLINQLNNKDNMIEELVLQKRILDQEVASKTKLLRERQDLSTKTYVNSALENQKRIFEAEIENRNLKIEMLEENLKAAEERIAIVKIPDTGLVYTKTFSDKGAMNRLGNTGKEYFPIQDGNMEELRAKIRNLEKKLADKDRFKEKEDQEDLKDKELSIANMMIQGFTKENERLLRENISLRNAHNIQRDGINGQTFGNTQNISNEVELKNTIARLQEELLKKDEFYRKKEQDSKDKVQKFDKVMKESLGKDDRIEFLTWEIEKNKLAITAELRNNTLRDEVYDQNLQKAREERDRLRRDKEESQRLIEQLNKELADVRQKLELKNIKNYQDHQGKGGNNTNNFNNDPIMEIDFGDDGRTQTNPMLFDLSRGDTNNFPKFTDPYFFNKSNQDRFSQAAPPQSKGNPLRASALKEDSNKDFEQKRKIIKSVLQKLEKGNLYQ